MQERQMNSILIVILIILCADFIFNRWLDNLNMKSWSPEIPTEAQGIYDEERYRKSREYHLAHHRLSQITSGFSFLLSVALLVTGFFGKVDSYFRTFTDNPVLLALMFFGSLAFLSDLISL